MENMHPWCGQPSDRGRLRNRTEEKRTPLEAFDTRSRATICSLQYPAAFQTNHPSEVPFPARQQLNRARVESNANKWRKSTSTRRAAVTDIERQKWALVVLHGFRISSRSFLVFRILSLTPGSQLRLIDSGVFIRHRIRGCDRLYIINVAK